MKQGDLVRITSGSPHNAHQSKQHGNMFVVHLYTGHRTVLARSLLSGVVVGLLHETLEKASCDAS